MLRTLALLGLSCCFVNATSHARDGAALLACMAVGVVAMTFALWSAVAPRSLDAVTGESSEAGGGAMGEPEA